MSLLTGLLIWLVVDNSVNICDVDENGVQHMVFCRVIMGNMEQLCPGTKQYHPSTEDFDSGVDDLQNPRHFTVWNMNVNTHVYPEFVVSFKIASNGEGDTFHLYISLFLVKFSFSFCP